MYLQMSLCMQVVRIFQTVQTARFFLNLPWETAGKALSRSNFGSLQLLLEGRVPLRLFCLSFAWSALRHGSKVLCGVETCGGIHMYKFILGLIIDTTFIRVSKIIVRLVGQCARIPWNIRMQPNMCSEEKQQRSSLALSALLASQSWLASRCRRPFFNPRPHWKEHHLV